MEKNDQISRALEFRLSDDLSKSIRRYLKKSKEIKAYLKEKPAKWWVFQDQFNLILDSFSREIGFYERNSSKEAFENAKKFFIRRLRKNFLFGHYINSSLSKPYGYAGDFKIIDDIYHCATDSEGYERLWDNYFLRMGPSIATRNRKEDFKRILIKSIQEKLPKKVQIMDLASGPCRELKELFDSHKELMKNVEIDCYDLDENAIKYGQALLAEHKGQVHFFKKNAIKLALKRNIKSEITKEYDLIFSTGLFDYLEERISIRLIKNLKSLLKEDGLMCISNYLDKSRNLWAPLMEWVAEWNLVYRSQEDFIKVFLAAGFDKDQINFEFEPLMIMQYCLASNK